MMALKAECSLSGKLLCTTLPVSLYDHLCTYGARLIHLVWGHGVGEGTPVMPAAMAEAVAIDAEAPPAGDGDWATAAAWLRTDAVGKKDGRARQWSGGREWMRDYCETYPPAWDVRTVGDGRAVEMIREDGQLATAPHLASLPGPTREGVVCDVLYSKARADMLSQRSAVRSEGGVSYRLTHGAIAERMLVLHTRPPDTARRRR